MAPLSPGRPAPVGRAFPIAVHNGDRCVERWSSVQAALRSLLIMGAQELANGRAPAYRLEPLPPPGQWPLDFLDLAPPWARPHWEAWFARLEGRADDPPVPLPRPPTEARLL